MTDHSLAVDRAVVRHGATTLADVADLRIDAGRPLTIVGESGSGKSLLAHALMGTLPPELVVEGSMTIGSTRFDLADRSGRRKTDVAPLAGLSRDGARDRCRRTRLWVDVVPEAGARRRRHPSSGNVACPRKQFNSRRPGARSGRGQQPGFCRPDARRDRGDRPGARRSAADSAHAGSERRLDA